MKKFSIRIVSIVMTIVMLAGMAYMVCAANNFSTDDFTADANAAGLDSSASKILGLIQWIGYAIAVVMIIYIGIKYMTASANEKADVKSGLIKFVIGVVVLATASTLAGAIASLVEE